VQAQFKGITIKAGSNYQIIPTVSKNNQLTTVTPTTGYTSYYASTGEVVESFSSSVGFDFAACASYGLNNKFSITVGPKFRYIKYDRDTEVKNINTRGSLFTGGVTSGGVFGDNGGTVFLGGAYGDFGDSFSPTVIGSPENGNTKQFYAGLSIDLRYALSFKWNVTASLDPMYLTIARRYGQSYQYNFEDGSYTLNDTVYKDTNGFNNFQLMAGIGASYSFNKQLGAYAEIQHAFTTIYDDSGQVGGKARLNTIALGLAYTFELAKKSE